MLDYQRIVDDLRSSLYAVGPGAGEAVLRATADYALACDEINVRLRKCGELLKAGLRSEAIQQCEIEPNLLDVVATLDFPERSFWIQLCGQYGILAPGPLMLDVAADLNEAYAIEQPMETLLARHRLLALAHSPLKMRIRTMRELAEVDTNNPIWREDLELFERERQKEIQRDAKDAATAGDVVRIVKLDREVQSTKWIETPAPTLVQWVGELRGKMVGKHAREKLEQLSQELNTAFSAFDVDRCRDLSGQWSEIAASIDLPANDALWQRSAPARNWLAQEEEQARRRQQHQATVTALEGGLARNESVTGLEQLYDATRRSDFELPIALTARYETRVKNLKSAEKKRLLLKIGAIAAVVILVVGFIASQLAQRARQRQIDENVAALTKLLDTGDWSASDQYVTRLKAESPQVLAAPAMAELLARLEGRLRSENDRRQAFEMALKQAHAAAGEAKDWVTLGQAFKSLAEAQKLAQQETEKGDAKLVELQLTSLERDLRKDADDRFTGVLKDLQAKLDALDSQATLSFQQRQKTISELRGQIQVAKKENSNASVGLMQQADAMLTRLDTMDEAIRTEQHSIAAIAQLTTLVGNVDLFRQALTAYAAAYPQSPHSADFHRAAEEWPLWDGIERYNQLAANWRRKNHQQLDPKTAKEMVAAARAVLESLGDFPDAAAYRERLPYLEAIGRRTDDKGSEIYSKLLAQLRKPWMTDLWMIETRAGLRYYLKTKQEMPTQFSKVIKYIADFDLSEKSANIKADDIQSFDKAPQGTLATTALDVLMQLDVNGNNPAWERTFGALAQSIHDDSHCEPLLRAILLKQVLEIGCQGSKCMEIALQRQLAQLNSTTINVYANWLDPSDQEGKTARSRSETALQKMPDLKSAAEQAVASWQSLSQPVGTTYRWMGWLVRDDANQWQCKIADKKIPSGDLVVMYRDGGNKHIAVDRIAKADSDKIEILDSAPREAFLEGRPIFLSELSGK